MDQNKILIMNEREVIFRDLAIKFKTDKLEHGYFHHYAKTLPDKCRSMLEIGVAKGASAKVWDSFYGHEEIDLFLLDLYMDPDHVSPRWVRNNGWNPIIGNQSDMSVLSSIKEQFEVIIDDGSHASADMIASFKHLFINNLRSGGQYYIEDTHCCRDSFFYSGMVINFSDTPLYMFTEFCRNFIIKNPYFSESEAVVYQTTISSVRIFDEKLILIEKK
jgi:hypothetical protein